MRTFIVLLCLIATVAQAQLREWSDYRTILWMSGSMDKHKDKWPLIVQRLHELGINTGMGNRDAPPQALIDSGFGYYVENIINKGLCLKYSSSVTNWGKFIDEWSKARSPSAFVRDYCFDDPQWLQSAVETMSQTANIHKVAMPLMYDLRDELSVTTSANPFDYDFSPLALAGFRDWLQTQYKDLGALNAQWDTEFKTWAEVMPFSTDQIKARMVTGEKHPQHEPDWSALKRITFDPAEAAKNPVRWNFSPWCDHRTYMDISLARTLGTLRDASHAMNPTTPVGIEGLQMPSAFGGYDLWRLSQVLDWAEPYDVGNSREILGSFMPGKPMVCTVFENDSEHARRRLWHLLLLGDKGCIVWWSEDIIDWTKPDLPLTPKGKALAPVLKEMCSPLAKLFIKAERLFDPIAIHYSQPSIQVAWLLESTVDGKTWPRRFSSFEATHNKHAQVRNSWLKLLQDMGYSPRFVSDEQMLSDAQAAAKKTTPKRVVVSPQAWALSSNDISASFTNPKFYDDALALFDQHGKFQATMTSALTGNIEKKIELKDGQYRYLDQGVGDFTQSMRVWSGAKVSTGNLFNFASYSAERLSAGKVRDDWKDVHELLYRAGINLAIRVPITARVRTHRFTLGKDARLIAFERNIDYKMSEDLAQAGGNAELEKPITFTANWNGDSEVYDLRSGKHLGRQHEIEVKLDPWQPSLYALLPKAIEGDVVEALSHEPAEVK